MGEWHDEWVDPDWRERGIWLRPQYASRNRCLYGEIMTRDDVEDAIRAELQSTLREFTEYLGTDTLWRLSVAYAQRGNAGVVDEWAYCYDAAMDAYLADFDRDEERHFDNKDRATAIRAER